MSSSLFIFVSDDTILPHLKQADEPIKKLLNYRLTNKSPHPIYLPNSILKLISEKIPEELQPQIKYIFGSAIDVPMWHGAKVIQELCLAAELLKTKYTETEIILVTDNPRYLDGETVMEIKRAGFSTVVSFNTLSSTILLDSSK
mgnify:CR=1 FL=1